MFKLLKESPQRVLLVETNVSVAVAVLYSDNHVANDSHTWTVSEKLLVCRFCIILLCFKELMVEINIVGFHLIQFTRETKAFISKALSLSAVLKS